MRSGIIDVLRFTAIVLMVLFHAAYDLTAFGFLNIDFQQDLFWYGLPRLIVALFMTSMGASLFIVHSKGIRWRNFLKRLALLVLSALVITISTYFMFPGQWIYFGTLHCIAVCSILALPFLRIPKWSFLFGILIIFPHLFKIYQYPFWQLSHRSMDYIPPLPWLGFVLIGISLGYSRFSSLSLPRGKLTEFLTLCSRHSLKIYLIHQPLLWSSVWMLAKIKTYLSL